MVEKLAFRTIERLSKHGALLGTAAIAIASVLLVPDRSQGSEDFLAKGILGLWETARVEGNDEISIDGVRSLRLMESNGQIVGALAKIGFFYLQPVSPSESRLEANRFEGTFFQTIAPWIAVRIPITLTVTGAEELKLDILASQTMLDRSVEVHMPPAAFAELQERIADEIALFREAGDFAIVVRRPPLESLFLEFENLSSQISVSRARELAAQNYVTAVNRAQQAYRLEFGRFASSLEELESGVPAETEAYLYRVTLLDGDTVQVTATAKQEDLKSYVGAVFVFGTGRTTSIVCGTPQPSRTPPPTPIQLNPELADGIRCAEASGRSQ